MTSDQTEVSALFQTLIRAFCYCLTVQRKYVQMKMDLRQVRRDTKATSEGKHSVVLQNLLRYIVLYRLFCSRFIIPFSVPLGNLFVIIVTIEFNYPIFIFRGFVIFFNT